MTKTPGTTDPAYVEVFENNRKWVAEMNARDGSFFDNLSKGQSPAFLYVGCADSRVPASTVMGVDPGNVFVHRNIANMVIHTDMNAQSVIEYAVTHLGVRHIVVCGHYGCGGVNAAMQLSDLGVLNPWLREVRDVYHSHVDELADMDEAARFKRLVELNVAAQCVNMIKNEAVQRRWAGGDELYVHGWVYDLKSGHLLDLNLDFSDEMAAARSLYRLNS
ncbi:MAG: carbonic anhydrase [Myxococcota bacterium]